MRKRYAVIGALAVLLAGAAPFAAAGPQASAPKQPLATGTGGAAATVDADATQSAIQVLRRGGNAVDAAIAANATLGVTEPYVAGIGGGGFMVVYLAKQHRVITIDGREKAPDAFQQDAFIDPATGQPYPFSPQRITSGMAVGVPGTLKTWAVAAGRLRDDAALQAPPAGDRRREARLRRRPDLPRPDREQPDAAAGCSPRAARSTSGRTGRRRRSAASSATPSSRRRTS